MRGRLGTRKRERPKSSKGPTISCAASIVSLASAETFIATLRTEPIEDWHHVDEELDEHVHVLAKGLQGVQLIGSLRRLSSDVFLQIADVRQES